MIVFMSGVYVKEEENQYLDYQHITKNQILKELIMDRFYLLSTDERLVCCTGKNKIMTKRVFLIGNGTSRKDFDLTLDIKKIW